MGPPHLESVVLLTIYKETGFVHHIIILFNSIAATDDNIV